MEEPWPTMTPVQKLVATWPWSSPEPLNPLSALSSWQECYKNGQIYRAILWLMHCPIKCVPTMAIWLVFPLRKWVQFEVWISRGIGHRPITDALCFCFGIIKSKDTSQCKYRQQSHTPFWYHYLCRLCYKEEQSSLNPENNKMLLRGIINSSWLCSKESAFPKRRNMQHILVRKQV